MSKHRGDNFWNTFFVAFCVASAVFIVCAGGLITFGEEIGW